MPDRLRCPRIYAHEARLLIRFVDHPALANRVGLDPAALEDPDGSIPIVSYYDLLEAAVHVTQDPLLGFHVGTGAADMAESRHGAGAVGMLVFASPTLRVGLTTMFEHQNWWNPGEQFDLTESGDRFFIRYRSWGPKRAAHDQLELRTAATILGSGGLVEGGLKAASIRFSMSRPAGFAEVEQALGCPIDWDAGVYEAAFPRADLEKPQLGADAALFRYAKGLLEQQHAESLEAPSYTALARREIAGQDLGDAQTLARFVAKHLSVSDRSLQRRLSEEGTSLRELIREARCARSVDLLRTNMSFKEVAHRVGYAETATFRRAFQRWYGLSPAAWRERDSLPRASAGRRA